MKYAMVLLVVLAIGCNKKGDDKVITESLAPVKTGVYEVCEAEGGKSAKSTVYVSESYVTEGAKFYSNSNCSGSALYELKTAYSKQDLGSNNYTFRIESAVVTTYDGSYTSEFSTYDFCEIPTWTTSIPQNILDKDCEGITFEFGNEFDIRMGMNGAKLQVSSNGQKFLYDSLDAMNFMGTTPLQNGNYTFYDGSVGMYFTASSPNFSVTFYDNDTRKYFMINGTYTTSGNSATFTVNASACPAYQVTETFTMSFAQTSESLGIRETGDPDLLLNKTSYSTTQYVSAFLNNPYTANFSMGCF